MLPEYIFIGPHKSGTSWIDNYLRYRGDVFLPSLMKETFFFDKRYERGLEWYSKQFGERTSQHRICVEVAPSLFDKPDAARRVASDVPNVVVICTMRNPIDRAVAHYFHHLKGGERDMGFAAMAKKHPELISNGLYFRHLNMWNELIGPERVRTLDYDMLNQDSGNYCRQISAVLGLPINVPPQVVMKERINEDGDPSSRLLAAAGRRTAETMRYLGAHKLVNTIRTPRVRQMIYGSPPDNKKRARVRDEALAFYEVFQDDFHGLDKLLGAATPTWGLKSQTGGEITG